MVDNENNTIGSKTLTHRTNQGTTQIAFEQDSPRRHIRKPPPSRWVTGFPLQRTLRRTSSSLLRSDPVKAAAPERSPVLVSLRRSDSEEAILTARDRGRSFDEDVAVIAGGCIVKLGKKRSGESNDNKVIK